MSDALVTTVPAPEPGGARPSGARTVGDEVLVIDFGGQYSQLIARRVRECGVFSELLASDVSVEEVAARAPKGLILSGGPASVYAEGAPALDAGAAGARDSRARHLLRHAAARRTRSAGSSSEPRSASSGAPS